MAKDPGLQSLPDDPTPIVGAETDVAPIRHTGPKPSHELTADEDIDVVDWKRLAATEGFRSLIAAKVRFIVPAVVFFIVYYFTLPVLVGYAPRLMEKKILGPVNLAYVFALSQFFMAWIIAALYVRAAGRFDKKAESVLALSKDWEKEK